MLRGDRCAAHITGNPFVELVQLHHADVVMTGLLWSGASGFGLLNLGSTFSALSRGSQSVLRGATLVVSEGAVSSRVSSLPYPEIKIRKQVKADAFSLRRGSCRVRSQ